MGAVAVALGLIWLAPGIGDHQDDTAPAGSATEYPGEPEDGEDGVIDPLGVDDQAAVDVGVLRLR